MGGPVLSFRSREPGRSPVTQPVQAGRRQGAVEGRAEPPLPQRALAARLAGGSAGVAPGVEGYIFRRGLMAPAQ